MHMSRMEKYALPECNKFPISLNADNADLR